MLSFCEEPDSNLLSNAHAPTTIGGILLLRAFFYCWLTTTNKALSFGADTFFQSGYVSEGVCNERTLSLVDVNVNSEFRER
jgi:uncharacterized protein